MRKIIAATAALIVSTAAMVGTPAMAGTHSAATSGKTNLSWQSCQEGSAAECTTIKVPVDWSNPGGDTFDLAVGRLPALDQQNRIGVLLVNPGGPGASGIDLYLLSSTFPNTDILRQRFDIVSWDPRGVVRSHPVQCSQDLLNLAPTEPPSTQAEYDSLLEYNAKLGADCRAHTGPLFDHVDTVSTVRDMDAIRDALGEQQVSYYGASYGTQIGQQYAELFPGRIRAMTLDSNMDHSITTASQYLETTTSDFESSFNAFADWCAQTAGCALNGKDVRAVWDGLYAKAVNGTLVDPATGNKIDAEGLRQLGFAPMERPEQRWPGFASLLASLSSANPARTAASPRTAQSALGTNSYQAIWCEDWKWGDVNSFADLQNIRARLDKIAPHTHLTEFWSDITSCLGWPAKVMNPQHRLSINPSASMLLTTSRFDVDTPNAWSTAVAQQAPNAAFLLYEGIGHADYFRSPCAHTYMEDYLTSAVAPPRGTTCKEILPTGGTSTLSTVPAPSRPIH